MQTDEAAWSVATDGMGQRHGLPEEVEVNKSLKRILRDDFRKILLLLRLFVGVCFFSTNLFTQKKKKNTKKEKKKPKTPSSDLIANLGKLFGILTVYLDFKMRHSFWWTLEGYSETHWMKTITSQNSKKGVSNLKSIIIK